MGRKGGGGLEGETRGNAYREGRRQGAAEHADGVDEGTPGMVSRCLCSAISQQRYAHGQRKGEVGGGEGGKGPRFLTRGSPLLGEGPGFLAS